MNKKSLSERDICTKFITPALENAGWDKQMQILEEVTIYVRKSDYRYLDFYIPLIKTCIEVHGEQHYNFTPFYHTNVLVFLKAQKKDREKKEWCEINNIVYIELPYNETDRWEEMVINAKNS